MKLSLKSFFVIFLIHFSALGSVQLTYENVRRFEQKARNLGAKYGPQNVLLAYDIDNTLLAANQALGSDAWYNWQVSLLGTGDSRLVAPTIEGILATLDLIYSLDKMHPPDAYEPQMVRRLQDAKFPSIILTARGAQTRDATLKHLAKFYDFSRSPLPPTAGYPGTFLPYSQNEVTDFGLQLKAPRAVSYMEGVFMTNGQHKGAMLRALLKKSGQSIKAIVFLDDMKKNCDAVYEAFKNTSIDVTTVRYSKEDRNNERFPAKMTEAEESWQELKELLQRNFPAEVHN